MPVRTYKPSYTASVAKRATNATPEAHRAALANMMPTSGLKPEALASNKAIVDNYMAGTSGGLTSTTPPMDTSLVGNAPAGVTAPLAGTGPTTDTTGAPPTSLTGVGAGQAPSEFTLSPGMPGYQEAQNQMLQGPDQAEMDRRKQRQADKDARDIALKASAAGRPGPPGQSRPAGLGAMDSAEHAAAVAAGLIPSAERSGGPAPVGGPQAAGGIPGQANDMQAPVELGPDGQPLTDVSLTGNAPAGVTGDVTGVTGDVTGITGDVTGITGDIQSQDMQAPVELGPDGQPLTDVSMAGNAPAGVTGDKAQLTGLDTYAPDGSVIPGDQDAVNAVVPATDTTDTTDTTGNTTGDTASDATDPNASAIQQYVDSAADANAANEARYGEALGLYDQIIAGYAPGGGYGAGAMQSYQQGKQQSIAGGMQNMVSAGMQNTTGAATLGQKYEQEVGNAFRLNLADQQMNAYTAALEGKAGVIGSKTDEAPSSTELANLASGAASTPDSTVGSTDGSDSTGSIDGTGSGTSSGTGTGSSAYDSGVVEPISGAQYTAEKKRINNLTTGTNQVKTITNAITKLESAIAALPEGSKARTNKQKQLDKKKAALVKAQDSVDANGNDMAKISSASYAVEENTRRQRARDADALQAQQNYAREQQLLSAQIAADAGASAYSRAGRAASTANWNSYVSDMDKRNTLESSKPR